MRKYKVLKAVVILQAICMVVLTVVVVIKVWPGHIKQIDNGPQASLGSDEDSVAHPSEQTGGQRAVAKVGNESITASELEAQLYKQHGAAMLRVMMVHKAIDLEAAASELSISSEEIRYELDDMIDGYDSETRFFELMEEQLGLTKDQVLEDIRYRLLLEKIAIRSIDVTDAEVERYIAEHPEQFNAKLELHLQWILTGTLMEANSVLELLTAGEDFSVLAQTYSLDSFTAEAGGDLGLIDASDPFYDQDMLDMASRLQVAEMAGPIKVKGGYAIVRLIERQMTTSAPGSKLQDTVRKQLAREQLKPVTELEDDLLAKYEATEA